jgi:hypothetical protein
VRGDEAKRLNIRGEEKGTERLEQADAVPCRRWDVPKDITEKLREASANVFDVR